MARRVRIDRIGAQTTRRGKSDLERGHTRPLRLRRMYPSGRRSTGGWLARRARPGS